MLIELTNRERIGLKLLIQDEITANKDALARELQNGMTPEGYGHRLYNQLISEDETLLKKLKKEVN